MLYRVPVFHNSQFQHVGVRGGGGRGQDGWKLWERKKLILLGKI